MKSISSRALSGSLVGFTNLGVMIAQSILLVPVLIHYWGREPYGVWLSVIALGTMVTTLDGGHQQFLLNKFNMRFPVDGAAGIREDLADGLRMALALGGIQALVAVGMVLFGISDRLFGGEANTEMLSLANTAFIIFAFSWWLRGSVSGVLAKLFVCRGDYTRSQIWSIWNQFSRLGSITLSAILSFDIAITMLIFCLISTVNSACMFVDIWRRYPDFTPWWRGGSIRRGVRNLRRSVVLTANGLLQQFSLSGLVILIGAIKGPVIVPAFTTIRTFSNLYAQVTNVFLAPLAPDLSRFHVNNEPEKLVSAFAVCWLINGILINLTIILSLIFIEPLYLFWTRGEIAFSLPLYLTVSFSVVLLSFGAPIVAYLKAINSLGPLLSITIARGLLVFGGAAFLVPIYGLSGAGMALLIAEIPASIILPLWHTRRVVAGWFFQRSTLWALVSAIFVAIGFILRQYSDYGSLLIILSISVLIMFCLGMQWIYLPQAGRDRLHGIFNRLIRFSFKGSLS